MPAPYASVEEAQEFYAKGTDSLFRIEIIQGLASDMVQRFAPTPSEETADYTGRAKRAELMVGQFLWKNPGIYDSMSLAGVGTLQHSSMARLQHLVDVTMGVYSKRGGVRMRRTVRG